MYGLAVISDGIKYVRGINNGKAGKAAALPKFSVRLTLSHPRGADYSQPLPLPNLKNFCDYAPVCTVA